MRENHAEPLQKLCLLIIFEGLIEKFVKNMPNLTYSAILLSFASKNSSQDGQFFKTIPANFGGNKEKYLPLSFTGATHYSPDLISTRYFIYPNDPPSNLFTLNFVFPYMIFPGSVSSGT